MDQRTRKLLILHKAKHHGDDADWQYVSRKERGRRLTSIKDSVDSSRQRLEKYIEKRGDQLQQREKILTTQGPADQK